MRKRLHSVNGEDAEGRSSYQEPQFRLVTAQQRRIYLKPVQGNALSQSRSAHVLMSNAESMAPLGVRKQLVNVEP